jgi:hypothetical protein
MQTGIHHASAASYLKQADEIFARSKVKTAEVSHPEAFIRARALALWAKKDPGEAAEIVSMIEGAGTLDELDLIGQVRLSSLTRQTIESFLQPKWLQTEAMLAHAKLFFENFQAAKNKTEAISYPIQFSDPGFREYFCYVLLDFATADPDLDEMAVAAALEFSKALEMDSIFERLLTKELHVKSRDLKRLKEEAGSMVAKAEVSP